jgi:hypothetical protein
MRKTSSFLVFAVLLAFAAVAPASPRAGAAALAASQGIDLWGGPGAKGPGAQGSQYDTIVYVTSASSAAGAVDFWTGGSIVATIPFTVPANGVAAVAAPVALAGKGAFAFNVRSDAAVTAWSETYNESSAGRYGVSLSAALPSELLGPGDEATGGGADVSSSTDPGRGRSNVGVVCAGTATQACRLEVAVFSAGSLAGTGIVESIPGGAAQSSLEALVPASAGKPALALRLRLLSGAGLPYVIRNDNKTSDGISIPLAVKRGAFSTAPVILSFTASPASGCAPLETTFSWQTTGATKVSISGVGNDLPANGSVRSTVNASGDFVLTATALTGQTAVKPLQITITPATPAPTPAPATVTAVTGGVVTGIFPAGTGPVTIEFVKHESSGSTFTVEGTTWVYTSGITPGTDIVRITATGSCSPATADFTANVVPPGTPRIVNFESIPDRGCAPSTNILLSWQTEDTAGVNVSGFTEIFLANASLETKVTATSMFTLTAYSLSGESTSETITVPVDPQLYVPIMNPGAVNVASGTSTTIIADPASVPDVAGIRIAVVQMQSRGSIQRVQNVPGQYLYKAGPYSGIDIIRFLWVNGCGYGYTNFTSTVTGEAPRP